MCNFITLFYVYCVCEYVFWEFLKINLYITLFIASFVWITNH